MTNGEGITDDVRKREEEYFRRQDRELIEKMRAAAAAEQSRKDLEAATGLHDPALVSELQALGFTPQTLPLLPLVPVLQVAWAEGGVSTAERTMILNLARSRGIVEGTPAAHQLDEWLATRPSGDTFAKAGRLIHAMLEHSGAAVEVNPDDLMKYCEQIAAASGGIFGIGAVSPEERAALEQIARQLKKR